MFDHLAWLKQMKIVKSGKSAPDTVKRAMTAFLVTNIMGTIGTLKKVSAEKDESKATKLKENAFMHFLLVIQCSHNSGIYETNNLLVGVAGVISSLIALKAQWPDQK